MVLRATTGLVGFRLCLLSGPEISRGTRATRQRRHAESDAYYGNLAKRPRSRDYKARFPNLLFARLARSRLLRTIIEHRARHHERACSDPSRMRASRRDVRRPRHRARAFYATPRRDGRGLQYSEARRPPRDRRPSRCLTLLLPRPFLPRRNQSSPRPERVRLRMPCASCRWASRVFRSCRPAFRPGVFC